MNINPNIKKGWNQAHRPKSVDYYFNGITQGDRYILSEAISLIESNVHRHSTTAIELLERCYHVSSDTLRIGITGSPGVGKSTFIEALGMHIIDEYQHRIAVLAIDPSSTITQGSILGDKTRMPLLSNHPDAFIRPSPSENFLGGVSSSTKETICLCEAAGYEVILIETVGVGQSETMVAEMVDLFALLLLPGAGDEIQGIKRGIVEMADMVIINKSDGDRVQLSKLIQKNYENALHLFQSKEHRQTVRVLRCSSLQNEGIMDIWHHIKQFKSAILSSDYLKENRTIQNEKWFSNNILIAIERILLNQSKHKKNLKSLKKSILDNRISPFEAIHQFNKILILQEPNKNTNKDR